ncbi:Holliday junction resolvase RuvX [Chloroherpeton thalassium]|uniref:Holliday junction resolvase RuvX n=1 Tax=Chloroherpeton thalassium TaxID=100716 RepID=UPI0002FC2ECF|nr:Holliday junction resolvase RuvX [Chloroherpeton thalassium]
MAIDFGTKRCGLAKTDPFQLFSQTVGTFEEATLYKQIREIEKLDGIEKILVGYPTNGDGSANHTTKAVDGFLERLSLEFSTIPIEPIDEFGSSKAAMRLLIASGEKRKSRQKKGRLDSAAAALLLQNYLERQR